MTVRKNRVTILDVAAEAGVSKSTAARVLTGSESTSTASSERVNDAARRLGYTPNSLARAMVSGETKTLGLIVTDISSSFFATVVRGFSDVARAEGFDVFLASVDRDSQIEERMVQAFMQKRVDGVAIAPVVRNMSSALTALVDQNTPLVLLDRPHPAATAAPVIMLDHEKSARLATERLVELGHTRIAVVVDAATAGRLGDILALRHTDGDREFLIPPELRLLGYLEVLDDHGIAIDPGLIIGTDYSRRSVRDAVTARLRQSPAPTAVFATDALMSSGAYSALADLAVTLPDDISFVAFDDQEWCTMVCPTVSTVTQPQYELGADAARILIGEIRGEATETGRILLPAGFIQRESSGPPPTGHRVHGRRTRITRAMPPGPH